MMSPRLGKRAFIPKGLLTLKQLREARANLKFEQAQPTRMETILGQEVAPTVIEDFKTVRGGFSLPRAYAMSNFDLEWDDATIDYKLQTRYSGRITPRDQRQEAFFVDLLASASLEGPQDILAVAATGSGKTVAGLFLARSLCCRTLIIVDSNKIARGWERNIIQFYGQEWFNHNVGRIQQDRCEYDKPISIAIAQSLCARRYRSDMYRAFGLVIWDEIQVFAAEHFARTLSMFPARVRVGFTAELGTGPFTKMVKAHLGEVRVVSEQEVLRPVVCTIRNTLDKSFYCLSDGALLTNLANIEERNIKLARLIKRRGYDRDRNVLVLSDRTKQLSTLRRMLIEMGVPGDAIGLHMGTYESERFVVYYTYEDSDKRNRLTVVDTQAQARQVCRDLRRGLREITGKTLPKALYNRLQAGERVAFEYAREAYSPSQNELDHITNSCQIILATYKIFAKGVDVPRLDMGVEALPSGNVKQPLGRILRLSPNKPQPEWYAIHDTVRLDGPFKNAGDPYAELINKFTDGKTRARMKAVRKANAIVSWQ